MFNENIKFKYTWRPYQAKVLEDVNKFLDDKRVNIVAAPGSGKTVLGLELARRLGQAVLILSPTVTIKNQWVDRFVTLFMPEGSSKPEWISEDVYKLSFFNSITYQGLHYAYKRRLQNNKVNPEETDDEILEEKIDTTNIDIKQYDLVEEIKKNKITTIVLDEAHHLKSEWWQSLTSVIKELENITVISLTATPPYDVEYAEWQKYIGLCGNIDMEISVPELVQAKNLCPHQDYIYFSYPTQKEEELIIEYEKNVEILIQNLKSDEEFVKLISNHPFIKNTEVHLEEILEKAEFYSSMLVFLNASSISISKDKIKILGHTKKIPDLNATWIEVLLQNILFSEDQYFESNEIIVDKIKSQLNKLGAIEKRKVVLSQNTQLQKYFINSVSKLESINNIVEAEYTNLKKDLRMVILTDFLRKEYLFEDDIEINKLGVFPIFLNLNNQNPEMKMAILTGSIFMIPNTEKENLLAELENCGISSKDIDFENIEKVSTYSIVKSAEKNRSTVMKMIAKLFSEGNINIIVGTKSLLGEGWDEPSINSLVLASFVGSYVLSNQMRGRAIRTNDNPKKTANVWHLVCAADLNGDTIKNPDFETLKRRFNSFVGVGYNLNVLENGTRRLDIIPEKFTKENINNYNIELVRISDDREKMYNRWFELITKYGGSTMKMTNQLETKEENLKNKILVIPGIKYLKFITAILIMIIVMLLFKSFSILNMFTFLVILGITLITNIDFIISFIRKIKFNMPQKQLKAIAKVVVKSFQEAEIVKTSSNKIKIYSIKNDEKITLAFSGVTTHENNVILNALEEIFSSAENQRYIIVNMQRRISTYFNVPSELSINKELAQIFYNNWKKYVGQAKMYYTRNEEGRKVLLEARKNTFDYTSEEKFSKKKKPISDWE